MTTEAVILAAGQGTRMKSKQPKVLHRLAGKPLLSYVFEAARSVGVEKIHTIIGHGSDQVVREYEGQSDIEWIHQEEQLGTGHAVLQAMPHVGDDSKVLVLYGDVPMLSTETLEVLLSAAKKNCLALLTVELANPTGYGRIVRVENRLVQCIVEEKDCTAEQRAIVEVNTGILAMAASDLKRWLPKLSNDNAQGEYYLTDLIGMAVAEGYSIEARHPALQQEVEGINSRSQLATMERWYQGCLAEELMASGVSLADPGRIDIRGSLRSGQDVTIDINLLVQGSVTLGYGVEIGPNCMLSDCTIGDNVKVYANTIIEGSSVAADAVIGPFARLRPGTVLDRNTKIGNFVETKKSIIGEGSKVNHLSYIGDSEIGQSVNIGAGTITCNYDGANKHKSVIRDGAFIGSNTSLVAPVTIGARATIGAGSTINADVDDDQLAVARAKQRNLSDWMRPQKSGNK